MSKNKKIFPETDDASNMNNIQIDDESLSYISTKYYAKQITQIIIKHLGQLKISPEDAIITDATAGVGGDTISFAKNFKHVHSIEIDQRRSEYLKNNINVYKLKNVSIYNNNCLNLLFNFTDHNVVFIDPPWGGKKYKLYDKLTLKINDITIESLCNILLTHEKSKKNPELVVLKLPINYDLKFLYDNLKFCNIYLYNVKKMYIAVIEKSK